MGGNFPPNPSILFLKNLNTPEHMPDYMQVTILDGYVDEPSRLGVPPYVSPYARYTFGAVKAAGHEPQYMTVDHWRQGKKTDTQLLFIVSGALVPGKYLRTMPISAKELADIIDSSQAEIHVWYSSRPQHTPPGASHVWGCDPDAYLFDLLNGIPSKRRRLPEEWNDWPITGADVFAAHFWPSESLIAELDFSYGCPHYITGGCNFCTEPIFGKPVFRNQQSIIAEARALLKAGCDNFRLGGGSCIASYMAQGIGETDCPQPNPPELKQLFRGLSELPGIKVLHTDNADPGILASHPTESAEVLSLIVKSCTSGNLLSLGLETADPAVAEANNLNSTPDQVQTAIKMINKAGSERGPTGLPKLLPGLNFVAGLEGETEQTYSLNSQFLKEILDQDMLLRRINIRQVSPIRRDFAASNKKDFLRFKDFVRGQIDTHMLEKVSPAGIILKDVYAEVRIGKLIFSRQMGTYPILVGIPDSIETGRFIDVKITGHGSRSLTGLPYPLDINNCSLSALEELPSIGKKRAARLFRARPIDSIEQLKSALDDKALADSIMAFLE